VVQSTYFARLALTSKCSHWRVDRWRLTLIFRDDILKWDMAETARGGPFQEILDVDIFVNCIYLSSFIPAFLTKEQISASGTSRKLSVVVDVSCDTTNPFNPIPIYNINTTFSDPTMFVELE
jgi:saccharopine dehydrogenase (NAD+, L-lysine-forming)